MLKTSCIRKRPTNGQLTPFSNEANWGSTAIDGIHPTIHIRRIIRVFILWNKLMEGITCLPSMLFFSLSVIYFLHFEQILSAFSFPSFWFPFLMYSKAYSNKNPNIIIAIFPFTHVYVNRFKNSYHYVNTQSSEKPSSTKFNKFIDKRKGNQNGTQVFRSSENIFKWFLRIS